MEDAKKKQNNQDNLEEYDLDFLNDNLNINQELDIQKNPKKYQADQKKKQLLKQEQSSNNKRDKNRKKSSVTYDDIFLCNEMFIVRSKTFPRFKEKNNMISNLNNDQNENLNNSFDDDDEEDSGNLRYNSFSFSDNLGDVNYLKKLIANQPKKINTNFEEKESVYQDEEEKKNQNIFFIENNSELNNLSYYSKNNRCNYSFISLNLFIKKLCLENLKENFPILYKSFLNQYHEIFSLPLLVEKVIGAFHYYSTKLKIEIPDLVSLLNHIISYQFKNLHSNEKLITQLKQIYQEIETLPWVDENLKKEIENVNYILSGDSNEDDDFDVDYTKFIVTDRKRTRGIQIKTKGRTMKPVVGNKKHKIPYFYIFDFSNEEIAKNLTLISYKLISSINYNELWNCNFSKENKNETAPNIIKIIERSDKLTLFIIEDICAYSDSKIRANAVTKWAEIADYCRELHNFSDLLTINNCLNRSCIKKLVKTWKKLPKKTITLLGDLNKFCSKQQSYINIRKAIANCKHLAYIPYIGILLEEIVEIEKKYDYFLCDTNFSCIKLQKIYFAVTKFFEFKNYSFTFMQLNDLNVLKNINPKSKEEIEELINQVEPKYKVKTSLPFGYKKRPTKTDQTFY